MKQRHLITLIAILLIISSSYLLWTAKKTGDSEDLKKWWSVSFTDSKSDNLDFDITNFNKNSVFHIQIFDDRDKIVEYDVTVPTEEKKHFSMNKEMRSKKAIIRIILGEEKKEIYKNL